MTLHLALAVSAVAGAAILLFADASRWAALVALVVGALEVTMSLGVLQVHAGGHPLGLALGLALAIAGLFSWFRASSKAAVTAAAVVALVGLLQAISAAQVRVL